MILIHTKESHLTET